MTDEKTHEKRLRELMDPHGRVSLATRFWAAERIEQLERSCVDRQQHNNIVAHKNETIAQQEEQIDGLIELCRALEQWFGAYPVEIFPSLEGDHIKYTGDYDTEEKRRIISRASAQMARHMISEIPNTIRKQLHEALRGNR